MNAMSGLSARTNSCGGDGDRFRGGGEGSLGGSFVILGKNCKMLGFGLVVVPSLRSSRSASDGTGDRDDNDERSDESSSAAVIVNFALVWGDVAVCGEEKEAEKSSC